MGSPQFNSGLARPWLLVAAICLFVVLDLTVLGLNVWISKEIDADAAAINLAGRQRMLSQRVTKSILVLDEGRQDGASLAPRDYAELESAAGLFDETLAAFDRGGVVRGVAGTPVALTAVSHPVGREIVRRTREIWAPFSALLREVAQGRPGALARARAYALAHNGAILDLMSSFTVAVESAARRKTERMRRFQTLAMVLSLANFLAILYQLFRRLKLSGRSQAFLRDIIDNLDVSVLIRTVGGTVLDCNQLASDLFGVDRRSIIGAHLNSLLQHDEGEIVGRRADGQAFFAHIKEHELALDGVPVTIMSLRDITAEKTTESNLSRLAYRDSLTKLPNRTLLVERMAQELRHAKRDGSMTAVLFLDLDGFKAVNDTHGHAVGDALLVEVAERLTASMRESDTVARLGGDEFVVVLPAVRDTAACAALARNCVDTVAAISSVDSRPVAIGVSVGVSVYPVHGDDADALLDAADSAMYEAKQAGKNCYRIARPSSRPIPLLFDALRKRRAGLLARISRLPLRRMLGRQLAEPDRFIDNAPLATLESLVERCVTCPSGAACDKALCSPQTTEDDYSFCPNDPVLRRATKEARSKPRTAPAPESAASGRATSAV